MSTSVKYVGPSDAVVLGDGTRFEHGQTVEVEDPVLAVSLLEQDTFEGRKPSKAAVEKAAKAKAGDDKTESEAPAPDEDPASADDPPQEG